MILPERSTFFPCRIDDGPYMQLLSYLDPDDLGNFSLVCKETDRKVRAFTTILKRIGSFYFEIDLYKLQKHNYALFSRQYDLNYDPGPLVSEMDGQERKAKKNLNNLCHHQYSLEEMIKISPDLFRLFLHRSSDLASPEIKSCYKNISKILFDFLSIVRPIENESYADSIGRTIAISANFKESDLTPCPTIENTVWELVLKLEGEKVAAAEEACKKFIQSELNKIDSCEIDKILETLENTFADIKEVYIAGKKFDFNQTKKVKEVLLGCQATRNDELKGDLSLFSSVLLAFLVPLFIIPSPQPITHENEKELAMFALCSIIGVGIAFGIMTRQLSQNPRIAEIKQNERGEEVVHYRDPPLRLVGRIPNYALALTVAYICYRIISKIFFE